MATRLVTALSRGLRILGQLEKGPQSAPEIATALSLPRATVHELLKTLEAEGFIRTEAGAAFALGMRLFELGSAVERSLDIVQVGREHAQRVAAECGETVQVALLDGTEIVYVAKVDSAHAVKLVSTVGARLPAHLAAVGKATLAYQPADELDKLYPPDGPLAVLTPNSISDARQLREALAEVRETGVAWDNCESNPDVRCVAAPVRDRRGAAIGGMSISVPTYRWDDALADRLRGLVVSGAAALSADLGAAAGSPA
ncbi:IclR family transcriptional regulator [Amycolatopsis ultiminotia]|uniref:IclR family transcriptional regulator n=1 Tax=Amycolatopsis ultiminotia TaxID=543629 RepID=A0ABP6YM00_9PSEU